MNNQNIEPEHSVVMKGQTETFNVTNTSQTVAKFILLYGNPLNEPIAQHGPFVMNSQQEIATTIQEYQSGQNGFENAPSWESKIQNLAYQ